ncbi:MAG: ABC transporter ATP-binding protein, partial [Candidatus Omnitrophica bacterium]|nr:ABC transporter ATP-binding protein [Candidatus Omnitrophota bacterium]
MTHAPRPPGPPFAIAGAGTPHAPIVFEHVSKRYQLSVAHDSLRDAIPALIKRLIRKNGRGELHEGEFWALKDVSFHVKQGETLGIIGHNGAGKSTILKLLSRITKQTKGSIALRGRLAALIELGGGFHSDLNGAENIYLQGTMLGLTHREVRNLFDSIVAFSELEQFLQTPVKRYSSGMIVKLGFAIAAHVHPDVLLLDEVLAVGDIAFQQKCFKRIDQLRDSGTTMIFISHNLEAVNKLCDRVLLLRQGEVIEEGTPGRIIKRFRDEMFSHALKVAAQTPAVKSSAAVQITQVNLTDPAGFPVDSVNTTEPLRVEIHYQAKRPVIEPNFRIAIERLDGLLCHGSLSRQNGLALKAL